jgi:hypothetical protein
MGEGAQYLPARLLPGQGNAEKGQFRRIAVAPRARRKEISDLDAPTGVERVFIKSAKTNDCVCFLLDDDPRGAADTPALSLMRGEIAPAVT